VAADDRAVSVGSAESLFRPLVTDVPKMVGAKLAL